MKTKFTTAKNKMSHIKSKCATIFLFTSLYSLLFLLNGGNSLRAASIESNGTGGGSFSTATTWAGGVVPGASDTAVIVGSDIVTLNANKTLIGLRILSGAKFDNNGFQLSLTNTGGTLNYIVYGEHNITGNVLYTEASMSSFRMIGPSSGSGGLISGTGELRTNDCIYDTITGIFNIPDASIVIGYSTGCGAAVLYNYGTLTLTNGNININTTATSQLHNFVNRGTITLTNGDLNLGKASVANSAKFINELNFTLTNGDINYIGTNTGTLIKNNPTGVLTLQNGSLNILGSSYFYNYGLMTLTAGYINGTTGRFLNQIGSTLNVGGLGEPIFPSSPSGKFLLNSTVGTTGIITVNYSGAGDQKIRIPQTTAGGLTSYWHIICSNSGVKTIDGYDLTILGDLTIQDAAVLDVSQDGGTTNNNIILNGNLNESSSVFPSFIPRDKMVTFSGTSSQTISSNDSGGLSFYDLTINNSSATGVTLLNNNIIVSNILDLTDGILYTGTYETAVTNTATASVINYGTASYVSNKLRRSILAVGGVYDFPVGNDDSYQLGTLNIAGGHTIGNILGSFTNASGGSGIPNTEGAITYSTVLHNGGASAGADHVHSGFWTFTPNAGTATYDVTLNARNYTSAGSNTTIVKRNDSSSAWDFLGSVGSSIGSEPLIVSRTGYSGFSDFAIVTDSIISLGIELSDFTSKCTKAKSDETRIGATIKWTTDTETNNDYFTLEKSENGLYWFVDTIIKGSGTKFTPTNYTFYEEFRNETPQNDKIVYYRLSETDFNGKKTVFDIRKCASEKSQLISLFPVPATGSIIVNFGDRNNIPNSFIVTDMMGRLVEAVDDIKIGESWYKLDISNYATGRYVIQINDWDKLEDAVFIKQ